MRCAAVIVLAAALLAGCDARTDKRARVETSESVAAQASNGNCGTASITFDERTKMPLPPELKPGGEAYGILEASIDTAWASACDQGLIPIGGLEENGKPLTAFKVFNNPTANATGIYSEDGYAILETPLFDGKVSELNLPDAEEIEEALYCFENGPPGGSNPEGRCLFD